MDGKARRRRILELIQSSSSPVSGASLARACGVSRQVIVQDIARIRSAGYELLSTSKGYVMPSSRRPTRLVKVAHDPQRVEEELFLVVDLGGVIEDVLVNHRTYGRVSAPLHIASRREAELFVQEIASSKSTLLSTVTSGYHYHHISAATETLLDEIEQALHARGFLVERLPYELEEGFV